MATPVNSTPPDRIHGGHSVPSNGANIGDDITLTPALSLKDSVSQAGSALSAQLSADLDIGFPPLLPPGDQQKLDKWVSRILITSPTTTGVSGTVTTSGNVGVRGAVTGPTAVENPYQQPGIMAILGPMMMELGKIFMEIQIQSAVTEVQLMQTTLSQAQEAKDLNIAAGNARAKQLEKDAMAHQAKATGAIVNAVSGGITLAMTAYAVKSAKEAGNEAVLNANNDRKAKIPPQAPLTAKEEIIVRAEPEAKVTQFWHGITQAISTVIQSSTSAWTETVEADAAKEKAKLEKMAAEAQGLASMLEKLTSTLQSSEQKASESGKAASQAWQGILDLMKSMAQLATQFGGGR